MLARSIYLIKCVENDTIESTGVSTMDEETSNRHKTILVRVAVWGQAIGFLWQVLAMAIEDSPDFFARANPSTFIWPIAVVVAMYLLRLDMFLAKGVSVGVLAFFILLVSIASIITAFLGVSFYFDIPKYLFQPGWQLSQIMSYITLAIFAIALIVNVICTVRIFRTEQKSIR